VFPTDTKGARLLWDLFDFFINFPANPTEHSRHRIVNINRMHHVVRG
jgi:hypothetical protein